MKGSIWSGIRASILCYNLPRQDAFGGANWRAGTFAAPKLAARQLSRHINRRNCRGTKTLSGRIAAAITEPVWGVLVSVFHRTILPRDSRFAGEIHNAGAIAAAIPGPKFPRHLPRQE